MPGYGQVHLTSATWNVANQPAASVEVYPGNAIVPHLTGRAYFADSCEVGSYSNDRYMALNLLGKTLRYTTDMRGAGCGCNAALYLTNMAQNPALSQCEDHYCDANNVCGESCAEIDLQEANQHAWHSTLHSAHDHGGKGVGFGGGSGWNGPRDFNAQQYGPGAECIDTNRPFEVQVSFPVDGSGQLKAMEVKLTQQGSSCPVIMQVAGYQGNAKLTAALQAGMTPIVSYWAADDMTWMDGTGADGQGPCAVDDASACSHSMQFSNFSVGPIGGPAPAPAPTASTNAGGFMASSGVSGHSDRLLEQPMTPLVVNPGAQGRSCANVGQDCTDSGCCTSPGYKCYAKNQWWASCKQSCSPGIDHSEPKKYQTPWSCKELGRAQDGSVVVIKLKAAQVPPAWQEGVEVNLNVAGQLYRAKLVLVEHHGSDVRLEARLEEPVAGSPMQAFLTFLLVVCLMGAVLACIWYRTGAQWWADTLTQRPYVHILAAIRTSCLQLWTRMTIWWRLGCDSVVTASSRVQAAAKAQDPSMLCGSIAVMPSELGPHINVTSPSRRRLMQHSP